MVFKSNDFLKDNLHKLHCNYTLHYILKLVITLLYHFFLQKHFFLKPLKIGPLLTCVKLWDLHMSLKLVILPNKLHLMYKDCKIGGTI